MLDWDDLRFFLELCRAGSRARAARRLRVDETTVARRLDRLERELGAPLVERTPGRIVLTEAGALVRASAEQMEEPALAVERRSANPASSPDACASPPPSCSASTSSSGRSSRCAHVIRGSRWSW